MVGNDSGGAQFPARTVDAGFGDGTGSGGVLKNAPADLMPAPVEEEWHHLVATFDTDTISLYLDGVELTDLVDGDPASWQNAQATIGGRTNGGTSHVQPFPGLLDELAVYNRVLSADEIKLHYEIGTGVRKLSDLNNDKGVDAADAGIMFAEWSGDPNTPAAKASTAEYNPETGELKISSAGSVNVFVQSASNAITPINPAPAVPVGLLTNNTGRVAITNLGPIEVTNFSFGNIGKGLAMSDLKLVYTTALGTKGIEVPASSDQGAAFKYIPEPASIGLVGLGLMGLLATRRRV